MNNNKIHIFQKLVLLLYFFEYFCTKFIIIILFIQLIITTWFHTKI